MALALIVGTLGVAQEYIAGHHAHTLIAATDLRQSTYWHIFGRNLMWTGGRTCRMVQACSNILDMALLVADHPIFR